MRDRSSTSHSLGRRSVGLQTEVLNRLRETEYYPETSSQGLDIAIYLGLSATPGLLFCRAGEKSAPAALQLEIPVYKKSHPRSKELFRAHNRRSMAAKIETAVRILGGDAR